MKRIIGLALALVFLGAGCPKTDGEAPTPPSAPVVTASQVFSDVECGYNLTYPASWSVERDANNVVRAVYDGKSVRIACAEEIPGIPTAVAPDNMTIDGAAGYLYHDASAKDGTPEDDLRVHHPKLVLDLSVRGSVGFVEEVATRLTWR